MATKNKPETYCKPGQQDFTLYQNQQAIYINKPSYKDKQFLQVGIEEMWEAKRTLSDAGFILYLYCASNMDGYTKAFSPQDFMNKTKMSRKSFYNARDDLEENGYLWLHEKDGKSMIYDCWNFYTSPEYNEHSA